MFLSLTLQDWANIATIVTAVVAVIAIVAAIVQIKAARNAQLESTANAIFADFMKESLGNSSFIRPADSEIDLVNFTFRGSREEFQKYDVFLALMLSSFEIIYDLFGESGHLGRTWSATMRTLFRQHSTYLSSDYFWQYEKNMDSKFVAFLKKALAK